MDRLLTIEDFSDHVGRVVTIRTVEGLTQTGTLASATKSRFAELPGARARFSLMIHGDLNAALTQGTYEVTWPGGLAQLFMVPLGPDADRTVMRYQIMFN